MDSLKEFLRPPMLSKADLKESWRPSDTMAQYEKSKKSKKIPYGPDDIEYKNNNRGFRCDDFTDWQNHDHRIVYAGCSFTEGIGLPLEDVWSKTHNGMVKKKIGKEIPYWSLAVGGTGTDQLVRNLFIEGERLRPQVVLAYIPYIERRERWHEDKWIVSSKFTKDDKGTRLLFTDPRYIKYQTEKNFAMISLLMEKWDSIFLFNTTDFFFEYYSIDLPRIARIDAGETLLKYLDYARDGVHAGPDSHRAFAEKFFDNSWPIIKEKLNI